MIRVDLSETAQQDLDDLPLLEQGRYTFEITGLSESHDSDKTPHVKVRCRVISGPSHVGAPFVEKFFTSRSAMKRFAIFLQRAGMLDAGDFGNVFELEESALVGVRMVADVIRETFAGKNGEQQSAKWSYAGFWCEGDEPGSASRDAKGKRVARPAAPAHAPLAPAGSADEADLF